MNNLTVLAILIATIAYTDFTEACVDIYRIDKYGQKHLVRTEFCYRDDCPYYQKWKDATVEKVYDHDIAPAKPVNRSATADLESPKQQTKKKESVGRKISNGFRNVFGGKKK